MQAHVAPVALKPKAIVIMGGLSMPNVPVYPDPRLPAFELPPDTCTIHHLRDSRREMLPFHEIPAFRGAR